MRRMVKDYTNNYYVPEMRQSGRVEQNHYESARTLALWKEQVRGAWDKLELYIDGQRDGQLSLGEGIDVKAWVRADGLKPNDLNVELVYGEANDDSVLAQYTVPMSFTKREQDGSYRYDAKLKPAESGSIAYNVRVVPTHSGLTEKYEMGLIRWA